MRRWSFMLYGAFAHLMFLAIYVWLACFVGGFLVSKTIDSHPADPVVAVTIDLLLIGLFAVQHSVMARPWFKEIWTKIIPQPIERSTYVMISNILTIVLILGWRGIDVVVWDVTNPVGRWLLWGLFAAGWLAVPAVTLLINHFDLFGTRQVWLNFRAKAYTSLPFRTPLAYRFVRHPLYVGWTLAFCATPTMTAAHALFAGALVLYMVIATIFEERDLVAHFGDEYRDYQRRTPRFVPRLCNPESAPENASIAAPPLAAAFSESTLTKV